jgi:hypothetical protein
VVFVAGTIIGIVFKIVVCNEAFGTRRNRYYLRDRIEISISMGSNLLISENSIIDSHAKDCAVERIDEVGPFRILDFMADANDTLKGNS